MMERDWLDRVNTAMKHYQEMNEANKEALESFVKWLYSLYGIVPPEKREGDKK